MGPFSETRACHGGERTEMVESGSEDTMEPEQDDAGRIHYLRIGHYPLSPKDEAAIGWVIDHVKDMYRDATLWEVPNSRYQPREVGGEDRK